MDETAEKFGMSCEQLANAMDVSTYTVYRLAAKGLIKTIWLGSRKVVPSEEVARLRREGAPTPRGITRTSESYKRKALRDGISKTVARRNGRKGRR